MENRKNLLIIGGIGGILVITTLILLYFYDINPHDLAVKEYNKVVAVIDKKNKELDEAIAKVQKLIDSNSKVIDSEVIETAKETTKKAVASKLILGEMPNSTKDIKKKTKELSTLPDYTGILQELADAYTSYDTSIKQYKQLTNPKEDFVMQRLLTIDEVVDARAVTEDNDPNGKLNKPGGYTATIYFESKNVNQSTVHGKDLIDKGTNAGGAIEVYANEEDAIKRKNYLAIFDGSILASGSHTVVGTILVRTSDKLPASKQKALEEKIIKALSELK